MDPDAHLGPTVELHLDVALAVATGEADAGLGVRSAAARLDLARVWGPHRVDEPQRWRRRPTSGVSAYSRRDGGSPAGRMV